MLGTSLLFRICTALVLCRFLSSSEDPRWVKKVEPGSYWGGFIVGARTALQNLFSGNIKENDLSDLELTKSNTDSEKVLQKLTQQQCDDFVEEAKRLTELGDLNGALDILLTVLDSNPYRIDINVAVGYLLVNLQKPDLAENFLFTAVRESNWTDASAVAYLVDCLRLNKDVELGEKVAMKGLNTVGNVDDSGMISQALGLIKAEKQEYSSSADWFLASALLQPYNIESWLRASTMLFPTIGRDLKFAENVLLQGIEINPDNAQLLYKLGVVMHSSNHIEKAIPLYEAALTKDETLQQAKSTLATAYHAVRRFEEAATLYEEAVIHEPTNVILLANYALLLCVELNKTEEGLQLVRNAKDLDPFDTDVNRAERECTPGLVIADQEL